MNKKEVKSLLKRKDVRFTVIAYPLLLLSAGVFLYFTNGWCFRNPEYYSFIMFFSCAVTSVCFALEAVIKTFGYRKQGDKLRLRQQEGIDIKEVKQINNGYR